jgi:hypothetical protein
MGRAPRGVAAPVPAFSCPGSPPPPPAPAPRQGRTGPGLRVRRNFLPPPPTSRGSPGSPAVPGPLLSRDSVSPCAPVRRLRAPDLRGGGGNLFPGLPTPARDALEGERGLLLPGASRTYFIHSNCFPPQAPKPPSKI